MTKDNGERSVEREVEMKSKYLRCSLIMAVIMCTLALLVSCGSSGGSGTGDEEATASIILNANPNSIPADGKSSSSINAALSKSSGSPVPKDTSVTFTTTLGAFRNGKKTYTVRTPDETGSVTVSLISGTRMGDAQVTAESNNVSQKATVEFVDGLVGSVSLTTGAASIVADGSSQALISATVLDTSGNKVPDGTRVTFTTTAGDIDSTTPGIQTTFTSSTIGGLATATLTSATNVGAATIRATVGGVTEAISVAFTAGAANTVSLTADPNNLTADGSSTSTIRAFVRDAYGNAVADGETISFSVTTGTGLLSAPTATTLGGVAIVTYTASEVVGVETVLAEATNGISATTNITLIGADIGTVTVSSGANTAPADGASRTLITATVQDAGGGNVEDGTAVTFTTTAGSFQGASPGSPAIINANTTNGKASVFLVSPTNVGTATIRATAGGVWANLTITFVSGPVTSISLQADPSNLTADGSSTSTIRAFVTDAHGNAVPGETISFSVSKGTGMLSAPTATTSAGLATVIYTASKVVGTETIRAESTNGTSATVNITLIKPIVKRIDCQLGCDDLVVGGASCDQIPVNADDPVLVHAVVFDPKDNFVPDGTPVTFETTAGTFVGASAEKTSIVVKTINGEVTAMLMSSSRVGTANIRITAGGVCCKQSVQFIPGPVDSIELTATPPNLPADGASTSTVRAFVTDAYGNAINGETVSFFVTAGTGTLLSTTAVTSDGVATVTYRTSKSVGTETIRAETTCCNNFDTADITLIEPIVKSIACQVGCEDIVAGGMTCDSIPAGTEDPVMVHAVVFDVNGNVVPDGTPVTFTTTAGRFVGAAAPGTCIVVATINGEVTAMLVPSTRVGTAWIEVWAGGVCCKESVEFVAGPVAAISLTATPDSILADGESTSTITALVTDQHGNPVDGETISFTLTSGTGSLAPLTAVTSDGIATVTYTSSTTAGTVTVTAESTNELSATVDITLIDASKLPDKVFLATSQVSVKSDSSDKATITATVLDANNVIVQGITVGFSSTGGQLSVPFGITDANGQAKVDFSSGPDPTNRVATITATVAGLTPVHIPIQVVGSTLTLTTDNTVVTSDGTTTATLTVTAKNAAGTPVYNRPITLSVSGAGGATLSTYSGNTNVSGQLEVTVTGTSEGAVTVTAEGLGVTATQNYMVVGTTAVFFRIVLPETDSFSSTTADTAPAITGPSTQIAFSDNDPSADTITRSDGGDFSADGFSAGDRIMVGGSASNDGVYEVDTVAAGTLTLVDSDALTTEAAGESITVTNGVLVRVEAPDPTTTVRFATTFGRWDGTTEAVITKAVSGDFVSAVFSSPAAGVATIHVSDADDASLYDQMEVVISAPTADAAYLTLQSNTYVVPMSIGDISHEAILTASVRTSSATGRQPVGGAPVAFSIKNQTGGGETIFPVVVFTDSSGIARTTFTSGSLSSGAEGVIVTATVLGEGKTGPMSTIAFHNTNPDTITRSDAGSFITDGFEADEQILVEGSANNDGSYIVSSVTADTLTLFDGENLKAEAAGGVVTITAVGASVNIVIGGTAGSIVIGRTTPTSLTDTTYSLPMSVLVSDSNGNPVSGASVSLSSWPEYYSTGRYFRPIEIIEQPNGNLIRLSDTCDVDIWNDYPNEDLNENLFLDPGEDSGSNPGHGDGELTPPNSAAGNIPMSITTDANGVANFSLIYMKSSAQWIKDRIQASTLVLGTETTSSLRFRLPAPKEDIESCELPDSPYNPEQEVTHIRLEADPSNLKANGSDTSSIVATLFDQDGKEIEGEVVTFEVTVGSGTIFPQTRTTDNEGSAKVGYVASTTSGIETVKATASNGLSATVEINLAGSTIPDKLSLATSQISVKSDNSDNATITATVLDADNVVMPDVMVTFSADGGQLSASSLETDAAGQAKVQFSSGTVDQSNKIVTITARVSGLSPAQIPIQVLGSTVGLSTDNNVITSDGATTATLTITARNAAGTPVFNTPITLSVSGAGGATLTPSSGNTNINGQLKVTVAGTSPGDITVTAAGLGATATQDYTVILAGAIFFRIVQPATDPFSWKTVDSGLAITGSSNQIAFADTNPDTITRSDGGDFVADGFNVGDRIMVGGSTSNDGDYEIAAVAAGTLTLVAGDSLTAEAAGATVTVTNGVLVRVEAPPPTTSVRFATTFGVWDGGTESVISKTVAGGFAEAVFSSALAGVATVHVSAEDNPLFFDSVEVVVSAPTADAAHITLQSNTYVVPISVGEISNTATLTASVRTSSATGRQPVGGAAVAFSIKKQTGGGETVFPVVVLTDSSGVATTTFTSGSLSSGAEGVTITAMVLGQGSTGPITTLAFNDSDPNDESVPDTITRSDAPPNSFVADGFKAGQLILLEGSDENDGNYIITSVTDDTLTLEPGETLNTEGAGNTVTITAVSTSTQIVIGGTAGSLVIGRGSEIEILSPTTYSLPMSVLVADSNGNPIPGAAVSLSAWPSHYSTGAWVPFFTSLLTFVCEPNVTATYPNEDANENLFLDPGEDVGDHPGHGDGQLTPPNSSAGTVPTIVTTDENGVANFPLVYMKSSAIWITDRIRASTLVLGTETTTSMTFRLPAQKAEAEACRLPDSPYNEEPEVARIDLTATPDRLIADGLGTSRIEATVTDQVGLPVEGEVINFAVTVGSGTLSSPQAVTDGEGVATVTYRASTTAGVETVRASAANGEQNTVNITLNEASVTTVVVTAGSASIAADGTATVQITANVLDPNDNPVLDGTAVRFETTAGTFLDPPSPPTPIGAVFNTTTVNGVATATLRSSTNVGAVTITATSGGLSDSTVVNFVPGPPAQVVVTATPANLTADGTSTSTVRATVLDANNNPIEDQATVTIRALNGTFQNGGKNIITNTVEGVATVTYTAPSAVPPSGNDTITASTTNGTTGNTLITLIGPQIAGIELSANPTSLPADGASQATVSALITLVGGGDAPDGTTVNFSITQGGGTITPTATTAGGVAIATLISGSTAETATVRAEAGGRTAEIQVEYTPGSVSLTIIPNSLLATGEATAAVTATLLQADNSPAPNGETVTFTLNNLSLGTLNPSSGVTAGGTGQVQTTFQAANQGGTVTVTGTWFTGGVNVTGSEIIAIQPPPAFIEVAVGSPDPTSINIKGTGGQSTSQITFDVKDTQGNLVADGYRIDFTIDSAPNGGENIVPISARTQGGQVSTILYSGFKSGPVSIKATYHNDSNISTTTSQIAINAGPPVGQEFGMSANYRNISGFWVANLVDLITVYAADTYGNSIPNNTAISFKTYNTGGYFESGSSTTLAGTATDNLRSSGEFLRPLQGFVSATAEAINGGRTTHVTSLVVTPYNHNHILYAGTDGGGVYKSIDHGATWENISRSSDNERAGQNVIDPHVKGNSAISVDPDNYNTVYVGTGYLGTGNVWRSLDGGMNWNSNNVEEWNGIFSTDEAVLSVLCDGGGSDYVWIGTEGLGTLFATDGKHFSYGGTVAPVAPTAETFPGSGIYTNPTNTGDGSMTEPQLSATTKTERWTATHVITQATASTPVLDTSPSGSNADGTMTVSASTAANDGENWTITYTGGYNNDAAETVGGAPGIHGNGTLTVLSTSPSAQTETWTITCIFRDGGGDNDLFSVTGSVSGTNAPVSASTTPSFPYTTDNGEVTFYITETNDFSATAPADGFTFSTTADGWSVTGDVSGAHTAARTGIPYTSDNGEVSFTIAYRNTFYGQGDQWTFSTGTSGYWRLFGTASGTQSRRAYNNQTYMSDGGQVTFLVVEGATPFVSGDTFVFDTQESGLGYGRVVRDIVQVPTTHGASAVLYAGTNIGVFRSVDGGQLWTETTSFAGDFITSLALHPNSTGGATDIIYAGTEDAGVWVSSDSGATWTQYISGMGEGLSATVPVPDPINVGNGVMSAVSVGANTLSENWSVTCTAEAPNGGTFSVTGSVSGPQANYDITAGAYNIAGLLGFSISDGSSDFKIGDGFIFATTRDPGRKIRDVVVDPDNDRLFAITYFWGPLEPHAVGNVYAIALNAVTKVPAGSWTEANTGLPPYDPPDDMTLFAQHVMALDLADPLNVNDDALYIGGEGINLYKAKDPTLGAGTPSWQKSKSGLTNLIMARMPVLFSGICDLDVYADILDETATSKTVQFTVYVQDQNGNPPITGSYFIAVHRIAGTQERTLREVFYGDHYAHAGTFRDPADPLTNNPYVMTITMSILDNVEFTFRPRCDTDPDTGAVIAPGCSGNEQQVTLYYDDI